MSTAVATGRSDLVEWCRAGLAAAAAFGDVRQQEWFASGEAMSAERLVKELVASDEDIVVLGHDVPLPLALDVAALLDREHPQVSTIMVAASSPTLWRDALRAGVRDVIEPGSLAHDLRAALDRAVERSQRVGAGPAPAKPSTSSLGRVIVVVAPKGGCGKTTVASNLAAALGAVVPGEVVALDLDAQFGDLAVALGLQPERTLTELAQATTIDSTTVKLHLTPFDPGLFVLCSSSAPEEADIVAEHHVTSIIRLLAREFSFVVVDTPAGLDERTLAAIEQASDLLLVSSFDVSSLRSLRKGIETLDRLGVVAPSRHLVLNRADSKVGLSVADVEAVIGMPVGTALPSSRAVPLSMNMGVPLATSDPGSPLGREFARLASTLHTGAPEEPTRRWKRRAR